jgi:small subunit ribosomal protein S2
MPYVTERWPGGMLTNFATIRKAIRKMGVLEKMVTDGTYDNISKKERLMFSREKAKLETQFGSIADLTRLPAAIFIVDITKEHIAVKEAKRLNIPTFAIVDTNSNPNEVDFPIPANDDASTSIAHIVDVMAKAISEGLSERKIDKETQSAEDKESGNAHERAEELAEAVKSKFAGSDEEAKSTAKRPRTNTTAKKKK